MYLHIYMYICIPTIASKVAWRTGWPLSYVTTEDISTTAVRPRGPPSPEPSGVGTFAIDSRYLQLSGLA
jgi:hypothetical protein